MEKAKDIINQILQDQKDQDLINTSNSKKPMKYKRKCVVCEEEATIEINSRELKYNKYDKYLNSFYFCSDKCRVIYEEKFYLKRFKVMPVKFRDIKCDKPEIVKQGVDKSMFITGTVGTGKTVLMAGIAKEVLKDEERIVRWICYPDFIMELQNGFNKEKGEDTPYDIAGETASYPGTLCIDDMGVEKMTAFVQQMTYYIINYREQEMLHTLITSYFNLQQIEEQIDERVSSRIGGMCKIIRLTGKDRRLDKGGQ